ncbi:hypothetical protein [Aureibacter tunicatorum]|uniref:Uncharacterized protein n=1 Tax=Aureibacter tunicatorum TaxID=866807 RepID=A0AAE3XSC7_9BACT|nr:hypothetical protein [Aureibacter tunicatorum]MDR6241139.1 hypothetical protein [Aureibacter tunicatorum]BDD03916.1 hypothetical protein AUTU_13990 [Aureibacter tunicatorum]
MNKDKIKYILNYHSSLMTKEEKIAWRHWSSVYKMGNSSPEQKENRIKLSLQRGWMTDDDNILKLLENGIDEFERKVAERIDDSNSIEYNNCPKCERITRTPKAKQCRFCGYDWH